MATATVAVRWIRVAGHPGLAVLDSSLAVLVVLALAGLVLFQVFRQGPVTVRRIQGATAAYLLLGLAWASAFEIALLSRSDAFRFPEGKGGGPTSLLYYSFVTLTTVGYGDITPVSPAARSLAVGEALVGQLFPAILIARLVSLELTGRGPRNAS
jgi:voltage-gated potassium channel Kch